MSQSKRRRKKRSKGRSSSQPPNRGHGSQHARRRSQQPSPELRADTLADKLRQRVQSNGGPSNPIEQIAQDSLKRQDTARERALQRARERRQADAAAGKAAKPGTVVLSPQDRALMVDLTTALREHTAALQMTRQLEAEEAAVDTAPEPDAEQLDDAAGDGDGEGQGDEDAEPEAQAG